jgi:hypothetical protein
VLRKLGPESRDRLHIVVISAAPISQRRLAEFKPKHWFVKPFPLEALVRALTDAAVEATDGEGEIA